jgi:non-specific serine/threonine protein kinase/serine/threonine-protein kinase
MISKAENQTGSDLLVGRPFDSSNIPDEEPGAIIDRYTLLRRIGDGGMGVVFEALQKEPVERRVALKLIRLGMDSRQIIARFNSERQLLAQMHHPNIAAFYDAGTSGRGRPYFVMEYIEGSPVTSFCDERRMTTRERLVLFLQICDAVQHAHQKGVIHRDLKPANIQVCIDGQRAMVKIIDFGIARIVSEQQADSGATRVGQIVGTPDYMSPEQLTSDGRDVDTRADVYALGVLLYELLVGMLPYLHNKDASPFAQRALPPSKPSNRLFETAGSAALQAELRKTSPASLQKSLRGDLDWIALRAMQPDRERRYASASELAADIRRHLDGRPVLARPDSIRYRLSKFVQRNRALVAASLLVVLALLTGVIASTTFAIQAANERTEAQRQTAIANAVNEYLNKDLLAQADPNADANRDVTLREIVDRSADNLSERFTNEPLVEAMIRMTLARTYEGLGEYADSEEHFRRALELRRAVLGDASPDTLETAMGLAGNLYTSGRFVEAHALLQPTLMLAQSNLPTDDSLLLFAYNTMALIQEALGRLDEALASHRSSVAAHIRILGRTHRETLTAMNNLAITLAENKQLDEAQALLEEILAARRESLGNDHPDTILSMNSVGFGYLQLADYVAAEAILREADEVGERVLGSGHMWQASIVAQLGAVYLRTQRPEMAEQKIIAALSSLHVSLGADHPYVVGWQSGLALANAALGRNDDAQRMMDSVMNFYNDNYSPDDERMPRMLFRQEWIHRMAGRCDSAQEILDALPETVRQQLSEDVEMQAMNHYADRCSS